MTDDNAAEQLRTAEQRELVERLAELAQTGMPLPEGLRAAASETRSVRLARQFRKFATAFESGSKWDVATLDESKSSVPPHILGAIRAGILSGNLGDALNGLVDQDRSYRDAWRQLVLALAYPLTLVVLTITLLLLALLLIVRPMKEIFADFGTELPVATQMWIQLSDALPELLLVISVSLALSLIALRLIGGRIGWSRFISGIPLFGNMIHLAGVSQMLRMLEVLVSQNLPLGEALRLTSSGAADANMQFVSQWLAKGVEAGVPLSDLMEATPRLPTVIVPIIRWGEKHGALGDAIRSSYDLLEGSIRHRGSMVATLLGPLMLIFVGVGIGLLAVSMFMPLVSLIQNLT